MADKEEEPKVAAEAAEATTEGDATVPAEEGAEKKEGGKAKGKGKGGKPPARKASALTKEKALAQINSLDPDDDEREAMSKKISWILRKGYSRIGIEGQQDWIKFDDLLNCDLLEVPEKSEEKLMSVIEESNQQKLRYEIKQTDNGKMIRALKKEERKSKGGHEPGEKRRPAEGWQAQQAYGGEASKLNGEAAAFVPGQGGASAAANPMAAYQMAYMAQAYGMGFNPYSMYGYGGAYAAAQAAAAAPKAKPADAGSGTQRFQGRIKSFNVEKGYGFIESAQSYDVYGRDVFLHKAHLGEKEVGAFVSFTVEMNKSGMPQGRDLAASDGSMAKGKGKGKGKEGGKGKGKGKGEGKEGKKGDKKDDKKEGDEAKESEETAAKASEDVDAK